MIDIDKIYKEIEIINKRSRIRWYIYFGFIVLVIISILIIRHDNKKEEVYIEKEPQISKLINKPNTPYIEVYRAPCRDDELIECIYMRIYPSVIEEIERHERSEASDSP